MSIVKWKEYWTDIDWASIDWIEELLYLCLAAMEACVIYPWYTIFHAISGFSDTKLPFWGMCLLLWIPYIVAGLLNRTKLPTDRKQALVAGLIILTSLVTVRLVLYRAYGLGDVNWIVDFSDRLFGVFSTLPPDLPIIVVVFIGWWRGLVLARKDTDMQQVGFHFRLGIVLLLMYFLVAIFAPRENVIGIILFYFFFGLMSIALARALDVGSIQKSAMGSRQWVAVLVGASLSSLALTLIVSLIFSRQVVMAVLEWGRPVVDFVLQIVWYIVGIMLYLLFPLIQWVVDLFEDLGQRGTFGDLGIFQSPLFEQIDPLEAEQRQAWMPYCHTILMVIALVVGLLLVARLIRRLAEQDAKRKDLERESVWSADDFMDDLKNSLQQGLDRLRSLVGQFGDRKKRSAESIRKIYASMVDLATEAGHPRPPAQTPY